MVTAYILGVILAPDLSIEKHVTAVSPNYFLQLYVNYDEYVDHWVMKHCRFSPGFYLPVISTIPSPNACRLVRGSPRRKNFSG